MIIKFKSYSRFLNQFTYKLMKIIYNKLNSTFYKKSQWNIILILVSFKLLITVIVAWI